MINKYIEKYGLLNRHRIEGGIVIWYKSAHRIMEIAERFLVVISPVKLLKNGNICSTMK